MVADTGLARLIGRVAGTLGRQLLGGLLQLVTLALIARFIGTAGTGAYAMGVLIPTMLATFLVIGMPTANVYYVGSRAISMATAVRSNLILLAIITLAALAIGAVLITFFGGALLNGINPVIGWVGLVSFPAMLAQNLFLSLLQAEQRFKEYNLIMIMQPALLLLAAAVYVVVLNGSSVIVVIAAHCVVAFVTAAVAVSLVLAGHRRSGQMSKIGYVGPAIKFGLRAHASNVLSFLNHKVDMTTISVFLGPVSVGIYVAASQITEKLWLLSQAVSTVALPKLAELEDAEDKRNQLTPLLCRWVFYISACAGCMIAVIANPLIQAIFGEAFSGAGLIMQILMPGIVLGSVSRVLASDLSARGRPELNMHTSWIAVVANVIGNVLLVPQYGIVGSAVSTSSAYALNMFLRLWMYRRITRVSAFTCLLPSNEDTKAVRALAGYIKRSGWN